MTEPAADRVLNDLRQGGPAAAATLLRSFEASDAFDAAFWSAVSQQFSAWGDPASAARHAVTAVMREPGGAEWRYRLGVSLKAIGSPKAAEQFQRAADFDPLHVPARVELFDHARNQGDVAAMEAVAKALAPLVPTVRARMLEAEVARYAGDYDRSVASLREAVAADPDDLPALERYIYYLAYHFADRAEERRSAAASYGAALKRRFHPAPSALRDPNPDRPLTIGLIGSNFKQSPGISNIIAFLTHRDKSAFRVLMFDRNPAPGDAVTQSLTALCDGWTDVVQQQPEQVAAMIAEQQVDVLVDTSWMLENPNMGVFACRAAPVQATWLNADGATGAPELDGWIITEAMLPDPTKEPLAEPAYRVPHIGVHLSSPEGMDVAPRWVDTPRAPTFGSFNTHWKLNQEVFTLWAELMRRMPEARLVVKSMILQTAANQQKYRDLAVSCGIPEDRLTLLGPLPFKEHLQLFAEMDVMLDPFPFQGGAAMFDALWMGVPVVALHGSFPAQRIGKAVLEVCGCPDWSVETPDAYLALAESLMRDIELRKRLRTELRQRLEASDVCDGPAHAKRVEQVLRRLWRDRLAAIHA